jgi:S-adenosylmethionine:tRNA ribosyltransferase-isomerase
MLSRYDYVLPDELVAQEPLANRSDSRMLVVNRDSGLIEHKFVRDFPQYVKPLDCIVINNTKVLQATLAGTRMKTGGNWEGLFVAANPDGTWKILSKTRGKIQSNEFVKLYSTDGRENFLIKFLVKFDDGSWFVQPESDEDLTRVLERVGRVPIPPYIRGGQMTGVDKERYQTVYALVPGAVAAPTAGLHFDSQIFREIEKHGATIAEVTLHVGIGTFKPIVTEFLDQHKMHSEQYEITKKTADQISKTKKAGGRIIAIGTTSVRVIESASKNIGKISPTKGETSLFIKPPYKFKNVDVLLTNFHFPKSTLLVLTRTFGGDELIQEAYKEAINKKYRFYSYGDAMLIL